MIQATTKITNFKDMEFSISNGKIKTKSSFIKKLFKIISDNYFPYVWEGDQDKALAEKMLELLPPQMKVTKYKPQKAIHTH